jgi:uncharacterized protein YkwD
MGRFPVRAFHTVSQTCLLCTFHVPATPLEGADSSMRTLLFVFCGLIVATSACNALSINAPTPVPPGWVNTIVVQTANAASTATAAAAPPPTATPVPVAACKDAAALVEAATAATGTSALPGSKFTKTWQLQNTGECNWHGYSIAFVSGDRLGAPDSVAIADTAPGGTVDIPMELVAPANAGNFTGTFELRDASGEPLVIDNGALLSLSVAVADMTAPTSEPAPSGAPAPLPVPPADCKYVNSPTYPGEVMDLINQARAQANPPLPPLKLSPKLATSAQAHSTDMACNGYFDHPGLNKSTIHDRVVAAGYTPSISEEMIYCSGYPKDAFTWWMGDGPHRDVILDKRVTEFGVGYAYLPKTQCGSYYTVDLASP